MRKTYVIMLAIFCGLQLNSFSQNQDEIADKLGNESKGIYLKDFKLNLRPKEESKISVVLSKNTKYEFSYYQNKPGQILFELFMLNGDQLKTTKKESGETVIKEADPSIKSNFPEKFSKSSVNNGITSLEYISTKSTIYHMYIKNLTDKNLKTVVLLSFLERNVVTEEEKSIPISNQEKTQDQNNQQQTQNEDQYFFVVEEMPKFNGQNADKFREFLQQRVKYPQEAIDKKIEGKVFVQFVIDKEGYIKEAKVAKGVHPALDQEALRIVYSSPRWQPGTQRGHKVMVVQTFPIEFKLP